MIEFYFSVHATNAPANLYKKLKLFIFFCLNNVLYFENIIFNDIKIISIPKPFFKIDNGIT